MLGPAIRTETASFRAGCARIGSQCIVEESQVSGSNQVELRSCGSVGDGENAKHNRPDIMYLHSRSPNVQDMANDELMRYCKDLSHRATSIT